MGRWVSSTPISSYVLGFSGHLVEIEAVASRP
jgi:hypothetical protein